MELPIEENFRLSNMVSTGSLSKPIVSEAIEEELNKYDDIDVPKNDQPGITIKSDAIGGTFILHDSGKYNLTGCKSEEDMEESVRFLRERLIEIGAIEDDEEDELLNNEIVNVVCNGNLGKQFNLNQLSLFLGLENAIYNAEEFSALVYRNDDYECTFQIFANSSISAVGMDSIEDTKEQYKRLIEEHMIPFLEVTEER